jgi:hypothetical protein
MDTMKARKLLGIARASDWYALPVDDQYDWLAYVRRLRKDAQAIGEHIHDVAERDDHFTVDKAIYIAILATIQELL